MHAEITGPSDIVKGALSPKKPAHRSTAEQSAHQGIQKADPFNGEESPRAHII
jgi:hypothetical protein